MRIGRTLPPAAAPLRWKHIAAGLNGWRRGVDEVRRFENEIRSFFDVPCCFLLSSGKAALTLILEALKASHTERDEVLIPAFCCYSVPSAIVRAGLKVRFCDLDPETLDFDFSLLTPKLNNPRLLAVVSVHQFGAPARVAELLSLAAGTGVTVIEDAAQGFGGYRREQKLGTLAPVALFSLGRGKALSTVEGGVILTRDASLARVIRRRAATLPAYRPGEMLRLLVYAVALVLLLKPSRFWLPRSLPFLKLGETCFDPDFKIRKLSAFQAGLARGWRSRIARLRRVRAVNSCHWAEILDAAGGRHFGSVRVDEMPDFLRFPWRIDDPGQRTGLLRRSAEKGLGIAATYPAPVTGIPELVTENRGEGCPVAERLCRTLVTLPVHNLMTPRDLANIETNIEAFAKKHQTFEQMTEGGHLRRSPEWETEPEQLSS